MARVSTLEETTKVLERRKGIQIFSPKPGTSYQMIFLADDKGYIQFANPVHQYMDMKGNWTKARCVKDHTVYEEDGKTLKRSGATGQVENDGSCPFCEVAYNYINWTMDKYRAENPDGDQAAEKEYFKAMADKAPVKRESTNLAMVAAIVELNAQSRPLRTPDGKLVYSIMPMKVTPTQFRDKLLPAAKQIIALQDEGKEDDGISFHEFVFNYPVSTAATTQQQLMESVKNLSISPAMRQVLSTDAGLREELEAKVAELNFEEMEEKIGFFRPMTIEQITKRLSSQASSYRDGMSDAEKDEAVSRLASEDKTATADDLEGLIKDNAATPGVDATSTQVAESQVSTEPTNVDGADAFANGSSTDVDSLLS